MKRFRKPLAALLAALMLISLLPLSAVVTAADVGFNLLMDGDFETDTGAWEKLLSTVSVVNDPTGSGRGKVMKTDENGSGAHMFQQAVSDLSANSKYILKFKVYTYAAGGTKPGFWATLGNKSMTYSTSKVTCYPMEVKTVDSSSSTRVRFTSVLDSAYNKWIDVEIPFSTNSNTSTTIIFSNYRANAGQYYFDDISLELAEAEDPGTTPDLPTIDDSGDLMVNGDFETGALTPWENLYGACTAELVEGGHDGSKYALNWGAAKKWSQVRQLVQVNPNTDYVVTAWVKNAVDLTLIVKTGDDMANIAQLTAPGGSEWQQIELHFNSESNTSVRVGLMSSKINATAMVDDVLFFRKPEVDDNSNLVSNGDFESASISGWTNLYGACTVKFTTGREGSNYALDFSAANQWAQVRQEIPVQRNTDYTASLWLKNPQDFSVVIKSSDDQTDIATITTTNHAEWQQWTVDFNSGENDTVHILLITNQPGGSAIVDDVSCLKANTDDPSAPAGEDVLTNGDFETGDATGWEKYQSTVINGIAAKDGMFGAQLIGDGSGNGILKQVVAVEPGKSYRLSFWYKPVKNGLNFSATNAAGDRIGFQYLDSRITNKWTKYQIEFESAYTTSVTLNFSGSGKGTADEVWLDNVKLENLSGADMDRTPLLSHSGYSIRDTVGGERGLAFRFSLKVNGAQANGYTYKQNTGTLKLFKFSDAIGKLVKFGAVVTNDEAIGNDAAAFNLEGVNGGTAIDIPAKYVLETSASIVNYAVRIINIPNHSAEADVYARPYYVYELDGQQVTVYGDIVKENYAHVDSGRSIIRVLTVGDQNMADAIDDHLYQMLSKGGYDEVILGSLYENGSSYSYRKTNNGTWTTKSNVTALDALKNERWQYVVLADADMTVSEIEKQVEWIHNNKTSSNLQILWNLPWTGNHTANVTAAKAADRVLGVDGVIPSGTAVENALSVMEKSDVLNGDNLKDYGAEYLAAATWYLALSGRSLEKVDYTPSIQPELAYNLSRAAARAYYEPYAVTDLSEVLLIAGSDFQPSTWEGGKATLQSIFHGLTGASGYNSFDGLMFVGDYTTGNDLDEASKGLGILDEQMSKYVNFNKLYTQGNHDQAGTVGMSAHGPQDPAGAPYGVFVVNEDYYDCYGNGGDKVAEELTAYFNAKLADGWGNKPIFVLSHLPLHFNYRTLNDKLALTGHYMIDAMNAASDAGLNIIYLFGHDHSGGYDDYAGGGAIYIPKGESIQTVDPNGYSNPSLTTQLRFTYMNAGYVSYYADMGNGSETCLSMSLFRIRQDGSVIITRYTKDGVHNLKSKGALTKNDPAFTKPDLRVYESSRIVSVGKDEPYEE